MSVCVCVHIYFPVGTAALTKSPTDEHPERSAHAGCVRAGEPFKRGQPSVLSHVTPVCASATHPPPVGENKETPGSLITGLTHAAHLAP